LQKRAPPVIVPARTADKARQALSNISRVERSRLDLLDPSSIDAFTREFLASGRPLHKSVAEGGDFKTPEQGAATSVWSATSPQLAGMGGVYCQDVDVAPILPDDSDSNVGVRPYAIDPEAAERLWALSEELTGVKI
jgi:hypothetical protein